MKKIGIIAAMVEEIDGIKAVLDDARCEEIYGASFHIGSFGGVEIVAVQCGIGKVNAAMCGVLLKERYDVSSIIATGIAGGIGLKELDVLVATGFLQHDVRNIGERAGWIDVADMVVFPADEELSQLLVTDGVVRGVMASGEQFIDSKEDIDRIVATFPDVVGVDMECAAIAHVCHRMKIPFAGMKCISDGCSEMDFNTLKSIACKKSIEIILKMLKKIST